VIAIVPKARTRQRAARPAKSGDARTRQRAARPATSRQQGKAGQGPVLHLLASGSGTADPAALLGSTRLTTLLDEAASAYDVVLIDSPPLLAVSDAIPVATAVDAVVVVARDEFTTRDAVQQCRQALERVPAANVLGVVANGVRDDDDLGRPYYFAASA
jgi:Mrp family chromosome partitioning ATPase